MDSASILQAQVDELQSFIAQVQARQSQLGALDGSSPPVPGDGSGGTNVWQGGGTTLNGNFYSTNDLWLEILSMSVSNSAANLVIHPPWNVANGVYDLFSSTNLLPAWWNRVLRCAPGQTNLIVTNLTSPMQFFILGLTNDTDGMAMSDAYERLLGLDPNNPHDDRVTPLVGISAIDSLAMEQDPANTASFLLTRLGGHMTWPLTVALQLSGTATISANYNLTPATVTSSNVLVTIPEGRTNVVLTLTAIDDHVAAGTKTATLTLGTDPGWQVDAANASATAWILEAYTKIYTAVPDFKQGVLDGLEAVDALPGDNGHLQFKTDLPPQFPFINVACSDRGTVARINVTNGVIMGEYRTTPHGLVYTGEGNYSGASPSRTTVDQYGNVWVANRCDDRTANGTTRGSITRIGLITGGSRFDKIDANYVSNPLGQYVALSNATYNTCLDRDGDGFIRTSSGLADILAWNNGAGADSDGGVSTADDEAITEYTRVPSTGTRTIAVDKFNDIWVGGHHDLYTAPRIHVKVNGLLAQPVPDSAFDPMPPDSPAHVGGYGGVIDSLGNLWSTGNNPDSGLLLWLTPPTRMPPQQGTDWQVLTTGHDASGYPVTAYGIAVDPLHPYIWQTTSGDSVFRWHTNGTLETDGSGQAILYYHGGAHSQGLAVDTNGHVWVAHMKGVNSTTVGHLNTNGTFLGNVNLQVAGLFAEYFTNTTLNGWPALTNTESPVDFSWTNDWPVFEMPANWVSTNAFSVRWSGVVRPLVQGPHAFYLRTDIGAACRLTVNGAVIIDNWTHPATNAVELAGTNWLGTNVAYDLKLEYAHATTNGPQIALSWMEPGMTNAAVVPQARFGPFGRLFGPFLLSAGATGISVDSAGKIWVGCYDSDSVTRIDPNAGPLVVTADGQTNHVGLVDMAVDLGDGTSHPAPYNLEAHPYNYSDMTGFNVRVVNPSLKPLKGYWVVVNDSGNPGQLWNKVSWTAAALTNGCAIEVYVRAADERTWLGSETFVQVTNGVFFPSIRGRYIEVRLGMVRDDPAKQPVVYDLTLYGVSSGFAGEFFLYDVWADEGSNAVFSVDLVGAEPMGYQWFRMYPWETNWVQVPGANNSSFVISNVDSWVDLTMVSVLVTNGAGESLWLGPAYLEMVPATTRIPAANYVNGQGPASRYPATINVFGQPTNINSVVVTLWGLSHTRSADVSLLLLSPSGKRIILMSNVGGINGVSNGSIAFRQDWSQPSESGPLFQPGQYYVHYGPSNYGQYTPQIPFGLPAGSFSSNLDDLQGDDPNGVWSLYIYDAVQPSGIGQLSDSWSLDFTFQ